jgi:Ca2+:H+ antiporter
MVDNNTPSASHDGADSTTTAPGTRRTSTSSMSTPRPAEQAGAGGSGTHLSDPMQNSQASIASEAGNSTVRRPRPRQDYGSMQGSSTGGRSLQSPALTAPQQLQSAPVTPKRPGNARKASVAPHRGDVFSVDDDPTEVDLDLRARKEPKDEPRRDRTLRRRESTLRRRPTAQPPALPRVESNDADEDGVITSGNDAIAARPASLKDHGEPSSEDTLQGEEEEDEVSPGDDDEDEDGLSDAESFTLKDRQEAINETHPFGIRIWKPALYKKNRSVQRNAEGDIHSAPGGNVSQWLWVFNALWTILFGWWLATLTSVGGILCLICGIFQDPDSDGCRAYGRVLINLAHYLFYPFGKYVKLERDEAYLHEDEGEGRDIAEYERWQAGDIEEGRLFFGPTDINRSLIGRRRDEEPDLEDHETDSLLGRGRSSSIAKAARVKTKKRLFGRGKWNLGRVIFFLWFYFLISPLLFLVSGICWFLVFTIPMGKVTLLLFYHLRRHPLAMSFHTDSHYQRGSSQPRGSSDSAILLCTYRAVGSRYWKYTIDGTNIFLINLLGLVFFAIFDYFVLAQYLGLKIWITAPGFMFALALSSIIPLAYFIGQAVASISAQSSMGVGATINAFFSTIVEVFLYCVALDEGKAQLVEGSIIGSIFAGILFLPGLSMCFGAIKRKTQRFNVRSAGVTSTMLLFAVIASFGPTLFYQFYGTHILNCRQCHTKHGEAERDCRRCYFTQVPELNDRFFNQAVRPYIYFCTVCLFLSYVVGLLFTLRTHAAVIWNNESDEKKEVKHEQPKQAQPQSHLHGQTSIPYSSTLGFADGPQGAKANQSSLPKEDIKSSQMYKRILNQSLKQAGVAPPSSNKDNADTEGPRAEGIAPHIVPPKSSGNDTIQGLSTEDNRVLLQQVAEIAATAATVAARDATKTIPRRTSAVPLTPSSRHGSIAKDARDPKDQHSNHQAHQHHPNELPPDALIGAAPVHEEGAAGGHDAPNWSRTKSAVILLTATVAYAVIAEILVDTVDVVLTSVDIPEKFLGITLFSLVPNTTEFLNAISFAMNGNVALSMEIGSSYALQVILLQVPCLVLFSAIYGNFIPEDQIRDHTFSMIFPQWDMVCVILSVFLMGWVVGEGKSNYFKGSILIFTYLVVVIGFWFASFHDPNVSG